MRTHDCVIGATGTLGQALVKQLLSRGRPVICLSRDELKQKQMESEFKSPLLTFRIADVKDKESLRPHLKRAKTVFHVAAYKHVDIAEINPEECIKTNVFGTMNVADMATECGVSDVMFSSTDKAVDPVNVYGGTKALCERVLLHRNGDLNGPRFTVFRWGNIMGSRGSVLHSFAQSLQETKTAHITHKDMTRFWMNIDDAANFVLENIGRDLINPIIPDVKAASISRVIAVLARVMNVHSYSLKEIGIRPGEKLHEVLTSQHSVNPIASNTHPALTDGELEKLIRRAMGLDGLCLS